MYSRQWRKRYCGQASARKFSVCDRGKVFSHVTEAKDFGIKGLRGCGVKGLRGLSAVGRIIPDAPV